MVQKNLRPPKRERDHKRERERDHKRERVWSASPGAGCGGPRTGEQAARGQQSAWPAWIAIASLAGAGPLGCHPSPAARAPSLQQKLTEAHRYARPCTEVLARVPEALRTFGYETVENTSPLVAESSWYELKYEPGTRMRHIARAASGKPDGRCGVQFFKEVEKGGSKLVERDWLAELELIKVVDPAAGAEIDQKAAAARPR